MRNYLFIIMGCILTLGCNDRKVSKAEEKEFANHASTTVETTVGNLTLEPPYATKSVTNESSVIGWPKDIKPQAPNGLTVTRFADELKHPRWIYKAPNND